MAILRDKKDGWLDKKSIKKIINSHRITISFPIANLPFYGSMARYTFFIGMVTMMYIGAELYFRRTTKYAIPHLECDSSLVGTTAELNRKGFRKV